jgi:MFS family permease
MSSPSSPSPAALFRHRQFAFYFWARALSEFSYQIAAVAVGWQIYALTNSALALGLIGLAQFVPTAALIFIAGHAADRFDRRRIVQICQIVAGLTTVALAWGSFAGWLNVPEIFAAVAVLGATTAFESPASAALLPNVAPTGVLQRATATSTAAVQVATISGPALGGFAYTFGAAAPYAIITTFWFIAAILTAAIALAPSRIADDPPRLQDVFGGIAFVRQNPAVLGAISLDLFAVLLGGATALLPIYARDILHTGAWGLGILRGAPAVGAFLMAVVLSRHSLDCHAGLRMFQAVIVFGLATLVFALSRSVWLSVLALTFLGAADTVSMVIRVALVQSTTPDEMRGRVGAVNFLFVNTSYQLGEFESGVTAALFGAVPAVLIGGLGTIGVALLWMKLFPALRKIQRLE